MTQWQWKVILAIIRMVLNAHGTYVYMSTTERTIDDKLLQEAIRRKEI